MQSKTVVFLLLLSFLKGSQLDDRGAENPVFKPFSGILGHFGKRKEAVKNCLEMVRVTGLEGHKKLTEQKQQRLLIHRFFI